MPGVLPACRGRGDVQAGVRAVVGCGGRRRKRNQNTLFLSTLFVQEAAEGGVL